MRSECLCSRCGKMIEIVPTVVCAHVHSEVIETYRYIDVSNTISRLFSVDMYSAYSCFLSWTLFLHCAFAKHRLSILYAVLCDLHCDDQVYHMTSCISHRAGVCIQCDVLWSLMRSFSAGSDFIALLPPRIQRSLMGSLIMSAMGERKKEFLTHVRSLPSHLLKQLQHFFN